MGGRVDSTPVMSVRQSESRGATRAGVVVIGLRLIIPITILRWPLPGAIASEALDAADVILVDFVAKALGTPTEFGPGYARIDKWLDSYYLAIEATESRVKMAGGRRAPDQPRPHHSPVDRRSGVRCNWRSTAADGLPELVRELLLVCPDPPTVYAGTRPERHRRAAPVLAVLLVPKLAQEWLLHIAGFHPWQLTKAAIGEWRASRHLGSAERGA